MESDNSYEIAENLFDRLFAQKIIVEVKNANSYFPKFVFAKKDLSHIITKSI